MSIELFRAPGIRVRTNDGDTRVLVHVGLGHAPVALTAQQAIELGAELLGFGLSVNGKDQAMVDDMNAVIRKHTRAK